MILRVLMPSVEKVTEYTGVPTREYYNDHTTDMYESPSEAMFFE